MLGRPPHQLLEELLLGLDLLQLTQPRRPDLAGPDLHLADLVLGGAKLLGRRTDLLRQFLDLGFGFGPS